MEYRTSDFSITVKKSVFTFFGNMEIIDYKGVIKFLENAESQIEDEKIHFDFSSLNFLNSIGLRSLSTYMLRSDKSFVISINKNVHWQVIGILPLHDFNNRKITIVQ